MAFNSPFKTPHLWVFTVIVATFLFFESAIPYIYAERQTPEHKAFLGQVAYLPDQNMYFSFISQGRDGHVVFKNKLTAIPHKPVFLNLEFCLVGWIQRLTGISENAVYQVWRFLGILLLTSGFVFLAKIVLSTARRVMAATVVALFSGGFGFLTAILNELHLLSPDSVQAGIIDMRFGIMPFQQMTTNPHFSFPHGLILFAYGFFLLGEKYGKILSYIICGLLFNVIGLVRPYDILPPLLLFPMYVLLSEGLKGFDFRIWLKKLLPLIMLAPVLLDNAWLFKVNDIFKWWSSQGLNAGKMPSVFWHYLAFGVCGILAIWRMTQLKRNPLSKLERFLVLWFAVTFTIIHLGKYFPVIGWSPQIGVYLAVPLALLGFSKQRAPGSGKIRHLVLPLVIVLVVLVSNLSIIGYFAKYFRSYNAMYYADKDETEAWKWIRDNIEEGSLVLASHYTSPYIAKYTRARVASGHYSVTPRYEKSTAQLDAIFNMSVFDSAQQPVMQQLGADYVYVGIREKEFAGINADAAPYLKKVFANSLVAVYKFQPLVK
jgi:hypothetical protein